MCAMSVRVWAQGPVDGAMRGHVWAVCGPYPHRCVARRGAGASDVGRTGAWSATWMRTVTGDFLMLRLPPGEYELRAMSRSGQDIGGIAVARFDLEGGDLDDVTLTLGPPRRSAQANVLGLSLAGVGGDRTVRRRLIWRAAGALPVESGQWEDLAELDSDASEEPSSTQTEESASDDADDPASRVSASDGAAATGLSYAGLPATQGEFSLDGLSGEQSFRAGPRGCGDGRGEFGGELQPGVGEEFSGDAAKLLGAVWDGGRDGGGVARGELGAAWRCVCSGARECVGGDESVLDCDGLQRWRGDERGGEAAGFAAAVWRVGGIAAVGKASSGAKARRRSQVSSARWRAASGCRCLRRWRRCCMTTILCRRRQLANFYDLVGGPDGAAGESRRGWGGDECGAELPGEPDGDDGAACVSGDGDGAGGCGADGERPCDGELCGEPV